MEQFDEYFAQNLVTYHSLTYNVEWIFVINKMDQVQYSEQGMTNMSRVYIVISLTTAAFNNCVERIKKTALKVLGQHRMDRLHFIPMSANDMSMRLTGDTSKEMTWHTGLTLWNALNSVANESSSSIFKLFRKLNVAIVQVNNRLNKPNIVIARVYVIGKVPVNSLLKSLVLTDRRAQKDVFLLATRFKYFRRYINPMSAHIHSFKVKLRRYSRIKHHEH